MIKQIHIHSDRYIRIDDLSNKEFISLIECSHSESIKDCEQIIIDICKSKITHPHIDDITNIDMVVALLNWKREYISKDIAVTVKGDNDQDIKVSNSIVNVIEHINKSDIDQYLKWNDIEYNEKIYQFETPAFLSNPYNIEDICLDCILKIDNLIITGEEKQNYIRDLLLSSHGVRDVEREISRIGSYQIPLIPQKRAQINANPFNIFEAVIHLYKIDMDSIYKQKFQFINKFGSSHEHYMSVSPKEINKLLEFTSADIAEQNKQQGSGRTPSAKMPSMPSIPKPRI